MEAVGKLQIDYGDATPEILEEIQRPADDDPIPTHGHSEDDSLGPLPEIVRPNGQQTVYGLRILLALTLLRKHVYPGTVKRAEKLRRRTRDRVAKRSRKVNR